MCNFTPGARAESKRQHLWHWGAFRGAWSVCWGERFEGPFPPHMHHLNTTQWTPCVSLSHPSDSLAMESDISGETRHFSSWPAWFFLMLFTSLLEFIKAVKVQSMRCTVFMVRPLLNIYIKIWKIPIFFLQIPSEKVTVSNMMCKEGFHSHTCKTAVSSFYLLCQESVVFVCFVLFF